MNKYTIRRAGKKDVCAVSQLALMLWPENAIDDLKGEFAQLLAYDECAIFLCMADEEAVGFAQCQLRHDYVEGTDSSPVGYLEGIFVHPRHRKNGCARILLQGCQDWAKALGCAHFASDCELDNAESLAFHLKMGFIEANRIICFTKNL